MILFPHLYVWTPAHTPDQEGGRVGLAIRCPEEPNPAECLASEFGLMVKAIRRRPGYEDTLLSNINSEVTFQ